MAASKKDSQIIEYKDTISNLNTTIQSLNDTIRSQQETIDELNEKIDFLTRKLFGHTSEKKQCEGQLSFFDEAEQEAAAAPPPEPEQNSDEVHVNGYTRKKKATKEETFKGVPVRDEVIPLSEDQLHCPICGAEMEVIGKELVRTEFRYTPAKGEVVNIYRETAKCPVCSGDPDGDGTTQFVKADVPDPLIPHSYATPSVVAWVMYQKYGNAIPLKRQEDDWRQMGVNFNRATLANWIITCSSRYFVPLYEYFHRLLLQREFLMADETRVQVLHEKDREPETDSFMWLFRTGEDGKEPIILYRYTQTRAKFNAAEFLNGFSGYLETDGYQGYNNLPNVKRCCCWSHLRRLFTDAAPSGKKLDYSDPATQGILYINRLFDYERQSKEKGQSFEQRKEYRLEKEKPVLDAFFRWASEQDPRKGSRFEKAVNYALNHKDLLMTYLEDGRCSFSNNASENCIRPFTVGRKNWLFSGSPEGADASATVYTMVEMAKAHNLNVYKYLQYLLERLPGTPMTDEGLSHLVPWDPEVQASCSGSL